jgi:lysophospholipase L1-like esterase
MARMPAPERAQRAAREAPPADRAPSAERSSLEAPLRWGELARVAGVACLAVAAVVLARPVAALLLAGDGATLLPGFEAALERLHLRLGVAGLALLVSAVVPGLARRRLPCTRGGAAVMVVAVLLAVAGAEGVLRVRQVLLWGSWWRTPLPTNTIFAPDHVHLRPGRYAATVASEFGPYHARIFFDIDRYGLRGPPPALPKPAGTVRVVALGGSSTIGWHVDGGRDWPSRLEARLAPLGPVEVVNAGRPGATTATDFFALRDRLLRLDPDVLVLYEGFNDLWRGVRLRIAEEPKYGPVDETLPPASGEALDRGAPRPWPVRPLLLAAKLGAFLEERYRTPAVRGVSRPPDAAIMRLYARNLRAMVRLARRRGVDVVVVTFGDADDPRAPATERARRLRYAMEAMPGLDVPTLARALARYRELGRVVARHEGVTLVDAAPALAGRAAYFTDTIHFTPSGEDALAARIAGDQAVRAVVARRLTAATAR